MVFANSNIIFLVLFFLLLAFIAILFLNLLSRLIFNKIADVVIERMLSEKYTKNISEVITSLKRMTTQNVIEMNLRAKSGKVIERPMGSPKHFPGFEMLMFTPSVMTKFPLPEDTKVDMSVTIGPKAIKPLTINIPLMISGMAYGLALSEEAKRAFAIAARTMGTAICSGEGPFLPEERQEAGKSNLPLALGRTN